jgi:hypothetical protein
LTQLKAQTHIAISPQFLTIDISCELPFVETINPRRPAAQRENLEKLKL